MTTSDSEVQNIMDALKFGIEFEVKPKILIPKLVLFHLLHQHMCKDGWTFPDCAIYPEFYYECFDDRAPVFKYRTDDGQIFVWNVIGFNVETEKESSHYVGIWPD